MFVPSTQRPLAVVHRRDLQFQRMDFQGRPHVLVKDPLGLKYYRLLPIQHRLLELLDGHNSWEVVYQSLRREFRDKKFTPDGLERLILDLHQKELILSTRESLIEETRQRRIKTRRKKWARLPLTLMFIKLPGWNADPVLRRLTPLCGSLFTPVGAAVSSIVIAAAWLFVLTHFDEFHRQLPAANEVLSMKNLFMLWLVMGAAKALHELGHAVACRRLGGECHEIGVAFLIFSPCLYCDVSGSWMMAKKGHRICVALAGMWVELIISTVCILIWWRSAPGLVHSISLQLFIATSVSTLLFNANPLLRYDGYYILSDLVETPNLQQRGMQAVRRAMARVLCGVQLPRDPFAAHDRFAFEFVYGVCSGLYRWLILLGIGLFLYQGLKPWGLQSLAVVYLCLSILVSFIALGLMFWRIMMSVSPSGVSVIWRFLPAAAVIIGLAAVVWRFPLTEHAVSSILIEPHGLRHVYAELPGELQDISVRVGERVNPGDVIAQFENVDVRKRLISLKGDETKRTADLAMARAMSNPDLSQLVAGEIQTVGYQIRAEEQRLARLRITVPCAGRVVSAPAQPVATANSETQFPDSGSHPLEPRNLHATIERQTHLCSIAPNNDWQAIAWADQDQCQFFEIGQSVTVMLDAYPGLWIDGRIESISSAQESQVPAPLSWKYGGELLTQTTEHGETPNSATYRIVILVNPLNRKLCMGMQGSVRYVRSRQSIGDWLTHNIYRTFMAL